MRNLIPLLLPLTLLTACSSSEVPAEQTDVEESVSDQSRAGDQGELSADEEEADDPVSSVPIGDGSAAKETVPGAGDEEGLATADSEWQTALSTDGVYEVSWRVVDKEAIPVNDHFELEVKLFRVDGGARTPWSGEMPKVRATMPEHRHGMLTRPEPVKVDEGVYRVPAMLFHMEGYWVLHFSLRTGDGVEDIGRADFDLNV